MNTITDTTTAMRRTRIGVNLPQAGALATDPRNVRVAAVAAEQAGYDSLWVLDRILGPVEPRSPYPASADGSLPAGMETILDPIGTLTLAAAVTERVELGTSVLIAPWYPPVLLARMLTTLDLISGGRVLVGLGTGWSIDEYESVDVPMSQRGARLDEAIDVLRACWRDDVVAYEGRHARIAPSVVAPKPARRGGPPILLGAYTPAALDRIARRADGWNPAGLPPAFVASIWAGVRDQAAAYGRDPDALRLSVRANIVLTEQPIDGERPSWYGTPEQVAEDLQATIAMGADDLIIGLGMEATDLGAVFEQVDAVAAAADLPVRALAPVAV